MLEHRREILVFEAGGRRFGLATSVVRELVRAVTIVPLPRAPAIVEGVINVRGQVVAVLDLRPRLGLPPKAENPSDHLIIVWARGRLVAIRVDRALELAMPAALDDVDVDQGPSTGDGSVTGRVARLPDGLVPLLDLEELLTASEFEALGQWVPEPASHAERERRP